MLVLRAVLSLLLVLALALVLTPALALAQDDEDDFLERGVIHVASHARFSEGLGRRATMRFAAGDEVEWLVFAEQADAAREWLSAQGWAPPVA